MSSDFEDDQAPKKQNLNSALSQGSQDTRTRIDLGDDLIEKTATLSREQLKTEETPGATPPTSSPAIEATIQNARILLNEGFSEEAKKILRHLLLRDSRNFEAQKLLEDIHASELKQMFAPGEPTARRSYVHRAVDESLLRVDSDQVLRALDQEFDLGIGKGNTEALFKQLEFEVAGVGATSRDRLDLAISFLEMELYAHAIQLLKSVMRSGEYPEIAVSLLAYCHLMNDEAFEAIEVLQPFINDMDIVEKDKVEFFYLMGRASQALGKKSEALGWYKQAQKIDPNYRDSEDRIKRLSGRL